MMTMTIPAAFAVSLTAPTLTVGSGFGVLALLGLTAVALVFGVVIARLASDCPTTGTPGDTFTPDASPRRRGLALLREAA
jgi:hypothetical protein